MQHLNDPSGENDTFSKRKLTVVYRIDPLSAAFQERFNALLSDELLRILLNAGVIAGGFVTNLLTTNSLPGDIDVFILKSNRPALEQLLRNLCLYFAKYDQETLAKIINLGYYIPSNFVLGHYRSVITVYHPCLKIPIQLIFTDKSSLQDLLTTFDLDYVQCGLMLESGQVRLVQSTLAQLAHADRRIRYYQWSSRLRMLKAQTKGFTIPVVINRNEIVSRKLKEPVTWTLETVKTYLSENSFKLYESVNVLLESSPEIPPFHRDTYWWKYQAELITDYDFAWNPKVSPDTHSLVLKHAESEDPLRRQIYQHLAFGQQTEALVLALYHRQKHSEEALTVTPSMFLRAPRQSLDEIMTMIESLLK